MPLTNPSTQSEYLVSIKSAFHDVRRIVEEHLSKASEKQARLNQPTNTWQPFNSGETVMLKRPNGWKLGRKWVGPYKTGRGRLQNCFKGRKEMVVHHDQLKNAISLFKRANRFP